MKEWICVARDLSLEKELGIAVQEAFNKLIKGEDVHKCLNALYEIGNSIEDRLFDMDPEGVAEETAHVLLKDVLGWIQPLHDEEAREIYKKTEHLYTIKDYKDKLLGKKSSEFVRETKEGQKIIIKYYPEHIELMIYSKEEHKIV